jgi:glycine C-acetyltransferase
MKNGISEIDPYSGVTADHYDATEKNLLARWQPVTDWFNARLDVGVDPYCRVSASRISTEMSALDREGKTVSGVNFASQEYLSLASHPKVIEAASQAASEYGVHSAGSAALMGISKPMDALEKSIASFLQVSDATVFPTGWGAGYGAIRTLVRKGDHIVMDLLSHACLQEAANLSGATVHRFPHCSTDGVSRRLKRIRAENPSSGILVITEGVFSMDSDVPDIRALQNLCTEHEATLFVDVAHDLGALGPSGRGMIEAQGMLGQIDIVMGSFSKSFASNGGFVATNHPALKLALRSSCGPLTFTNALSPVQAAVVQACLDIVGSEEGELRRKRLMANIIYLRDSLVKAGFSLLGEPSAIVPVVLGDNTISRIMTREILKAGAIVNLVEHPAVARNSCRWRLQVMTDHTPSQIDHFVKLAKLARERGNASL